jgi:ParB family transcriptional regulator, chromosome partitioning protein
MNVQTLECDKIEFLTTDQVLGRLNLRAARELVTSIKADRRVNPIVVRPNPEKPGHYLGIQGREHHHAMLVLLKKPSIACHVLTMDDPEAILAAITANLFRHELDPTERIRSIKRWYEHFRTIHPDLVDKGHAGGAARKKKVQDPKQAKVKLNFASQAEKSLNFAERLAAATGVSETTAQREVRRAINLTDEQLEVCQWKKLKKGQIASIASLAKSERKQVVDLIANGRGFDEAWRQVDPKAKKASGKSRDQEAAEAAAKREEQPDLSDADWFDQCCGDKAKMIPNRERFKADALVFRRLSKPRHLFRTKAKATLEATDQGLGTGPFIKMVQFLMAVSHPNEWPVCVPCNGDGKDEVGNECSTCSGAGYLLECPAVAPTILAELKRDDPSANSVAKPDPSPSVTVVADVAIAPVFDDEDPFPFDDDEMELAAIEMSEVR